MPPCARQSPSTLQIFTRRRPQTLTPKQLAQNNKLLSIYTRFIHNLWTQKTLIDYRYTEEVEWICVTVMLEFRIIKELSGATVRGGARNYTCTTPQCLWPFASNTLLKHLINVLQHRCFNDVRHAEHCRRDLRYHLYKAGDSVIYWSFFLQCSIWLAMEKELKSSITMSGSAARMRESTPR